MRLRPLGYTAHSPGRAHSECGTSHDCQLMALLLVGQVVFGQSHYWTWWSIGQQPLGGQVSLHKVLIMISVMKSDYDD